MLLKLFFRLLLYILYNLNINLYKKYNTKFLRFLGVNVLGEPDYIDFNVSFDSTDYSLITLGDGCTITGRTLILTHDYASGSIVNSRCDVGNSIQKKIGKITIGSNSFIGANSIILPGITIGKNSIVGAGSVVTKDVPDETVVAGNPAKKICSLRDYYYKRRIEFKSQTF